MNTHILEKPPFSIRLVQSSDIAFIYSTWLNATKYDSDIGKNIRKSVFFEHYRLVIDHILSKETTNVLVACKPDEPSVIFGYLVSEPETIHFCFVKESFRNLGIARSLYESAFSDSGEGAVSTTHETQFAEEIIRKHFDYNPFLLYQFYQE